MDFSAPHAGFVIAAYALTAVALVGLVGAVLGRLRRVTRLLQSLEVEGTPRRARSEGAPR